MHQIAPPNQLLTAIRRGHRFLITSHRNPDGDAVGSELGLARILRKLGKSALVWNYDPTPEVYKFIVGSHLIHVSSEPPKDFPKLFDAIFVLESPSLERTGLKEHIENALENTYRGKKIKLFNIDHHLGNEHYGTINWIDTSAPAVGEMIFRLADALNVTLDKEAATALYVAVMTDTGGFKFGNTNAAAFTAAARMVKDGADPQYIASQIYENKPLRALKLMVEALSTVKSHLDGRILAAYLTNAMISKSEAKLQDSEGLIDYLRGIKGVEVAVLIKQIVHNEWKVSLRSKDGFAVDELAREYGGGGHRQAAAFSIKGDFKEIYDTVINEIEKRLTEKC